MTAAPPTEVVPAAAPGATAGATRGRPRWLGGVIGTLVVLALWALISVTPWGDAHAIPTPWSVVAQYGSEGSAERYWTNGSATMGNALWGFVWGNGLALAVALVVLLLPALEGVATQIGVVSYCIPITAIGPIVMIVFGGQAASVFLSAISVFFTSLTGMLLGLKAADRTALDVITAYGGSRLQQLTKVRVIAALPATMAALKISVPAALLGAIIGEYLGQIDTGIGVALTSAQQKADVPLVWGLAIYAGLLAGIGYLVVSVVARLVTPWTAKKGGTR